MINDLEIPAFVFWGGFTGLILLAISIILFITYSSLYNEAFDSSAAVKTKQVTNEESGLYLAYIVSGSLGFLLSMLIPFGHYIKSHNDPTIVATKNSLHAEISNVEENSIEAHKMPTPSDYTMIEKKEYGSLLTNKDSNNVYNRPYNDNFL